MIPYEDIPLLPEYRADRHGIFKDPPNYMLEVWVQGEKYAEFTVWCYESALNTRDFVDSLCAEIFSPMLSSTPWQRVLVEQILHPWLWGT